MTEEERKLWYLFLKNLTVTIKRQQIVGNYILDFYCAAAKIGIELDGSQHYENENRNRDKQRDEYLNSCGIEVLRYSNYDVKYYFDAVCCDIMKHIEDTSSVG